MDYGDTTSCGGSRVGAVGGCIVMLWAARCWAGIATGEMVVSHVQNVQTGPGAHPAIQ